MLDPERLEQGLELFERLVQEDGCLREEFQRSAAQYFLAGAGPDVGTPEGISAARRHLEWFLFERIGDPIRELVAEQLLERWRALADPELAAHERAFLESHAGIFAVTDVDPGQGAWLEDLAGLGRYPVAEAEASHLFAADDLIVGRLFPVGDSLYRISHGAGFFREPNLVRALEDDMQRLRRTRSHQVLRIAQRELEATFWGAQRWAGGGDPVGDARRTLIGGGVAPERADALLAALRAAPLEPSNTTPGFGDPLAAVLEELAFDSAVDLGQARAALLLAWQHASRAALERGTPQTSLAQAAPTGEPEPSDEVRRALAELDQRLQAGRDVLESFDELERALGLDALPDEETDDEEGAAPVRPGGSRSSVRTEEDDDDPSAGESAADPGESEKVPDFPGVVGAMVEEFLWEQETFGSPLDAAQAQCLRLFAHIERSLGVFEELEFSSVLRFAAFWLPERGALDGEAQALAALDALERFCDWAEEQHALVQLAGARDKFAELRPGLARATVANRICGATPADVGADEPGELFELRAAARGRACLRDARGAELEFPVDPELLRLLQPGDRLRAIRVDGRLRILRCYPPQLAQLV